MPSSIIDKHINQIPEPDNHKVHLLRTGEQRYRNNNRFYCQLCYFKNAQHVFIKYNYRTKIWTCPVCLYEIDTTLNQRPKQLDDIVATNDPIHSTIKPIIVPMKHFNITEDRGTDLTDKQLANEERDELDLPQVGNPKIIYHTASEAFKDMDEDDEREYDELELDEDSEYFNDSDSRSDHPSKMVKVY